MSNIKTDYRGKLAYVGMGRIGTIVKYYYEETIDEVKEYWVYRPLGYKKEYIVYKKPIILQKATFKMVDEILNVTLKIKGQYYPGWSIKHPKDEKFDNVYGKRLAVARAMGDEDAINHLLDKDFVDSYDKEYHPDGDNAVVDDEDDSNTNVDTTEATATAAATAD